MNNEKKEIITKVVKKLYGQTFDEYAQMAGVGDLKHDAAIIEETLARK